MTFLLFCSLDSITKLCSVSLITSCHLVLSGLDFSSPIDELDDARRHGFIDSSSRSAAEVDDASSSEQSLRCPSLATEEDCMLACFNLSHLAAKSGNIDIFPSLTGSLK
jgi:hypothetical protein